MGGGDYERTLGVIEAITFASQQCPNASVRACAERALETIRKEGAGALPAQAYLLLTSMRGWRGERASQIHRSLRTFLAEHAEHAEHETDPSESPQSPSQRGDENDRKKG